MQAQTEEIKNQKNPYPLFSQQSYMDVVPGYPVGMAYNQLIGEVEYVRKGIQKIEGVEIKDVSQFDFNHKESPRFPRFFMHVTYLGEAVDLSYYPDTRGDWWWIKAASKGLKKSALDMLTNRIYSEIIQPRMQELAEETKKRIKESLH